ncbi:PIN domain-containing protein [Candidatus Woesearchaeota archaeon]|nr:PIN domain-containing protein [Candidatus Woesearchaeota archaeon]
MNKIIIDSSAWIEYFKGTEKGRLVREQILKQNTLLYTTGLIVAEVCTKFLKEGLPTEEAVTAMKSLTSIIPFDFRVGEEAAKIYINERKKREKFGLADAHVIATARLVKGKILTCDYDFHEISEALVLR